MDAGPCPRPTKQLAPSMTRSPVRSVQAGGRTRSERSEASTSCNGPILPEIRPVRPPPPRPPPTTRGPHAERRHPLSWACCTAPALPPWGPQGPPLVNSWVSPSPPCQAHWRTSPTEGRGGSAWPCHVARASWDAIGSAGWRTLSDPSAGTVGNHQPTAKPGQEPWALQPHLESIALKISWNRKPPRMPPRRR